jgi:hypothetical protein
LTGTNIADPDSIRAIRDQVGWRLLNATRVSHQSNQRKRECYGRRACHHIANATAL